MNNQVNSMSQALVKKPLDECSVNELRQLTQQFPYYSPLHVLLSAKLKSANDEASQNEYQRTALYFSNVRWLDYLLTGPATVVKSFNTNDSNAFESVQIIDEVKTPVISENFEKAQEEIESSGIIDELEQPVEFTVEEEKEEENVRESELPASAEIEEVEQKELLPEPATNFQVEEKSDVELDTPETAIENTDSEPGDQPLFKMPQIKISAVDTSIPLTFEPYHTVDYFASQGIKMKEENKPTDRFSQQLKSFTEWLKTMKKIPEIVKTEETVGEQKVEQMAAVSIADREIITEAMAEVWEKQGERQKAREIYSKLSLLDPSKSAYFAAKIESLK